MGCKLEFLIPEDCEYEFSDDLTELEIKDLEIALNYSNVKYAKFTDDEKEYYTISSNLTGEYEGVNLGCDNNLVINLPKSKYYNYNKKLLYVELENYKYAVELDPDLYIIIFEDKIKNSQYIEKIFREKGFILISEFQLRDRITEKQNMNALSLINLLHYTEVIDIVKIINGKAVNYGTLRKDSSSFKQFVTEYKNSIKLNTRYNLNLDLLVYDINYLPEHGGTL